MMRTKIRSRRIGQIAAVLAVCLVFAFGFYYFHYSKAQQFIVYSSRMKDVVGVSIKSGRVLVLTLAHEPGTFRVRFLRSDNLSDVSRGDTLDKDTNSLLVHFRRGKKDLLLVMDPTDLY